ncbi:Fc.00g085900.m01.CDS01 [Cosmosporella sp. VM-42]
MELPGEFSKPSIIYGSDYSSQAEKLLIGRVTTLLCHIVKSETRIRNKLRKSTNPGSEYLRNQYNGVRSSTIPRLAVSHPPPVVQQTRRSERRNLHTAPVTQRSFHLRVNNNFELERPRNMLRFNLDTHGLWYAQDLEEKHHGPHGDLDDQTSRRTSFGGHTHGLCEGYQMGPSMVKPHYDRNLTVERAPGATPRDSTAFIFDPTDPEEHTLTSGESQRLALPSEKRLRRSPLAVRADLDEMCRDSTEFIFRCPQDSPLEDEQGKKEGGALKETQLPSGKRPTESSGARIKPCSSLKKAWTEVVEARRPQEQFVELRRLAEKYRNNPKIWPDETIVSMGNASMSDLTKVIQASLLRLEYRMEWDERRHPELQKEFTAAHASG